MEKGKINYYKLRHLIHQVLFNLELYKLISSVRIKIEMVKINNYKIVYQSTNCYSRLGLVLVSLKLEILNRI